MIDWASAEWVLELPLGEHDAVYGSGESFLAVDLRGTVRELVNRETDGAGGVDLAYLNVPFFYSDAGWGVWLDTGAPVLADVGATDPAVLRLSVVGDSPAFERYEGTPAEILATFTERTGRAGAWPDWAFGVWMSRATYLDEAELHAVLDDLAAADCPVDVMHVDAWLAGNVFREFTCSWEVDRARFPAGWTDRLRARGVRASVWLNPFVLAGTPLAAELAARGLLLRLPDGSPAATSDRPDRWLIDFTNPAAVDWWGGQVRELLATEAPDALKLDFAEEVPLDARTWDGRDGLAIRNAYAMLYQRATAEAIPADHPPVPFFCRSGTARAQANPCHWVGDTPATWEGMAGALRACLSLSASGFALVTHDGGGFHSPGTADIPATLLDGGDAAFSPDVDPELYGRWAQFAALSPVTRFHGLGHREPTAYPEPWRSAAIEALRLRGRLRPLLVAAFAQAQATGMPVLRPMALDPRWRAPRTAVEQYMLGPDLLVAPVLRPGGHVRMWFPPGGWRPLAGAPVAAASAPSAAEGGWMEFTLAPHECAVYLREGSGHDL